jgi:hypothetical protein
MLNVQADLIVGFHGVELLHMPHFLRSDDRYEKEHCSEREWKAGLHPALIVVEMPLLRDDLVFWNQPGRSVVVDALPPHTDRSERVHGLCAHDRQREH